MPIQFLSAVESTSLLQSPDVALLDATGVDPTPVSDALREILGASTHAQALYDYVNGHDVVVRICACTSTSNFPDTVFDCKLDPPVIYFRTDVHVTYATTSSNTAVAATVDMSDGLVLMHELGHAKQFLEDGEWYTATEDFSFQARHAREIEIIREKIQRKKVVITDEAGEPVYEEHPMFGRRLKKEWVESTVKYTSIETVRDSLFSEMGYNGVLEYDNMLRHEYEICDELGIPRRMIYTDACRSPEEAKSKRAKRNWDRLRYAIKKSR